MHERAQEFETLVQRSVRLGRLDPYELLDTYLELQPSAHPHLGDPRVLDLAALAAALASFPHALVSAPRVFVVRDLTAFSHSPLEGTLTHAGLLDDGTLLLEARLGALSIMGLAASLCVIAHELDKARRLLPEDEALDETLTPPSTAALAFALGTSEHDLLNADAETDGMLLAVLSSAWQIPDVSIHPQLAAAALRQTHRARAERILSSLAEMGLYGRPIHLWVGNASVTDCLSPYTRELRNALLQWAEAHRDTLADDVNLDMAAGEDLIYVVAQDFLQTDERLLGERDTAERTVGILRHPDNDLPFDIIDMGRLDPSVVDARLTQWQPGGDGNAPVLLRIGTDLADASAETLRELVMRLREQLKSITLTLEGSGVSLPLGSLFIPDVAMSWAGEHKVAVPGANRISPDDFVGLADNVSIGGALLSVPHVSLLSTPNVSSLAQRYNVRGVDVGGVGVLRALADLVWQGTLGSDVDVLWALVTTHYTAWGRPTLESTAAFSSLAIARLRRMLASMAPPAPPPSTRRDRPRPSGSGRVMRIKA